MGYRVFLVYSVFVILLSGLVTRHMPYDSFNNAIFSTYLCLMFFNGRASLVLYALSVISAITLAGCATNHWVINLLARHT